MGIAPCSPESGFRIPEHGEAKRASHFGNASSIACEFPRDIGRNCLIVGTLYEYAPAQTGINGLKVTGCRTYKLVPLLQVSTPPGITRFFAVFAEGVSRDSTLDTNTLTTNEGSTVTIDAEFFW